MQPKEDKNVLEKVFAIYEMVKTEKKPYRIKVFKKEIIVLPGVFSPKYFSDSKFFAGELPKIVKNRKLLEIGTGTGIVAVFCALNGASIVATDINPSAVRNCKLNAKELGLEIDVREGNLFGPVKGDEKFDFIFWNHPFNYVTRKPNDILLRAGLDYRYEELRKFMRGGKKFLNPGGCLILGTGSIAKINEIKKTAKSEGYKISLVGKSKPLSNSGNIVIEYRIYKLMPC